ncbi:ABC transporter permease subunit [Aquibacillus rhizosphaerae]|uniref:ABC transporter permease subunit n=1 Tax=Aquibacillus rhizosphaerae TaxID=3051431 RepID=A0ABT7L9Z5_9BACI|nr:ABC transporter permease subunit [Aquibacillus sp. LR5S19]MDL4842209.1 ABC transporter permease subunit [Aquibacillus sp. LR5S19]
MIDLLSDGLQSIPKGQFEAAKAIGLHPIHTMTFIIMPQALRAVIPDIVGQSISMFKDTSLVAIVGLMDILGIAQTVKSNPEFLGSIMETYLFIAFCYWIIAYSISYASRRLEKTLGVGER